LQREIARAKRTRRSLVLAFVDVDDLKGTNDSLGHPAGDQRLRQTAKLIKTHLRSYDLVVRYGGDEFVCALTDLSTSEAAARFQAINADLADGEHGSITLGMAALRLEDSLQDLIARADQALYRARQQRHSA
jgi:diguanylate cyclase (GGDEF)-like protein